MVENRKNNKKPKVIGENSELKKRMYNIKSTQMYSILWWKS